MVDENEITEEQAAEKPTGVEEQVTEEQAAEEPTGVEEPPPAPRIKPKHVIFGAIALLVAAFTVPQLLSSQPGERTTADNVITQTIAVVSTDSETTFQTRLIENGDAAHEATHMFEALTQLVGIGKASLDTSTLELTVAYDSASINPEPIRKKLVEVGYVAPAREDATAAKLSADGKVQRIEIVDEGGFRPNLIRVKSGVPVEIVFGPGTECRVGVVFPDLGITQDITNGGTVKLPALEPGQYTIACSGGAPEGTIYAE